MLRHRDFTGNSQLAKPSVKSDFRSVLTLPARTASAASFHPNSFLSDVRSVQVGRSRFSRCYQRLIGYRPTGVFRFAFEGLQHVGEASLMVFIDRAIGCNDDHARQARRAEGPEGFAVQIDKG